MSLAERFVPARILSRRLAQEIEPALRELCPRIPLALAMIGPGSDVLGYDTARSMDHDWGPRLTIVVPEHDVESVTAHIESNLASLLPAEIDGCSTRFSRHNDGTLNPDPAGELHRIEVTSVPDLLRQHLLIDSLDELTDAVWLSTPMQSLLELTAGEVFVDDTGELTSVRNLLSFYPDHIWRYQLAGLWMRVSQVQPFIGRCFETGDVAGAAAIAMTIQRDLMRIMLLQSRRFAPYSKWLGTAVKQTALSDDFLAIGLNVTEFEPLEAAVNSVGGALVEQLNELALIPRVDPKPSQFHARPYFVLPAEEIALTLKESVNQWAFAKLENTLGGIDVITDSTDALGSHEFRLAVRSMFHV